MNGSFDLQSYMTKGVERVVAEAVKATLKNPRESAFMLKFAAASRSASKKRRREDIVRRNVLPQGHRPPRLRARLGAGALQSAQAPRQVVGVDAAERALAGQRADLEVP